MNHIITTRTVRRRYQRFLHRQQAQATNPFIGYDCFAEPIVLPAERAGRADAYYRQVYGMHDSIMAAIRAVSL